ncbi:YdcF family protein [Levilactobacillus bambusae]|uniref:DUF218 domain-containing protein n=1 Tax=Levilactobacillus bambusae TaxID=2024736 RepID=A0A2V1MXQ0_9LACO|nr:YdcF family protein [Levilactobacillus bambusae]PWF99776.1 hypothetical protein DCM90_06865 [Levilactobacillus bambusae]
MNSAYYFSPELYYAWIIPIAAFAIFFFRYRHTKVKLSDGLWFNLFFYSLLFCLALTIIGTQVTWFINLSLLIFFGLFFIILLLFSIQAFLLIWNGILMWRRESHTLANTLTLIIGFAILITPLIMHALTHILPTTLGIFLADFSDLVLVYVLFWFYNYLTVAILYQFNRPKLNQDFIIVLGAGLMNGNQVTPLLAQRIQRGLAFYRKQVDKTGKHPTMIFSGGQGGDETIPEGQAMLNYAEQHGLPAADGIAETASKNTAANMQNSKALIDQSGIDAPNVIFVSNNYHTYRAGRLARQVGLRADGIGARTSWFFIPDAVIREYIAIFMENRRWHFLAILFFALLAAGLAWAQAN